jgi:hypothetical protein
LRSAGRVFSPQIALIATPKAAARHHSQAFALGKTSTLWALKSLRIYANSPAETAIFGNFPIAIICLLGLN